MHNVTMLSVIITSVMLKECINDAHYAECQYASLCWVSWLQNVAFKLTLQSVDMHNVTIISVIMLSLIMLNVNLVYYAECQYA